MEKPKKTESERVISAKIINKRAIINMNLILEALFCPGYTENRENRNGSIAAVTGFLPARKPYLYPEVHPFER